MSESHAADSPLDEERAKREAEEFKARMKAALGLVDKLDKELAEDPSTVAVLSQEQVALFVWYIRKLQESHRTVHTMLFHHIIEMQNARRAVCLLC